MWNFHLEWKTEQLNGPGNYRELRETGPCSLISPRHGRPINQMNKSSLSLQYWIMSELHLEKQVLHVSNFVSVCKHYHSSKVNLVIFYKEDQTPSLQSAFAVGMRLRLIWVFPCQVRLRAVSLFLENPLGRPEERKQESMRAWLWAWLSRGDAASRS